MRLEEDASIKNEDVNLRWEEDILQHNAIKSLLCKISIQLREGKVSIFQEEYSQ